MKILETISNDSLLKEAFVYISKNNTSNVAPYHNLKHMCEVMLKAYEIMRGDNFIGKSGFKWNSYMNYQPVLVAALFHDYNHSQGKENDSYNIKEAIKGFNAFVEQSDTTIFKEIKNEVVDIIKATEYPYVIPSSELSYGQKVIRDADLLVSIDDNFFFQNVFGLKEEMCVDSVEDMILGNIKFHENIKLECSYSKTAYKNRWNIMDDLNTLKDIFNI
jgi:hypothetical protein